ncbi:MAG: hypothetical protein LBJ41_09995 [Treponema sp.]|nr:hypothetical protein [Treponema sp.]
MARMTEEEAALDDEVTRNPPNVARRLGRFFYRPPRPYGNAGSILRGIRQVRRRSRTQTPNRWI